MTSILAHPSAVKCARPSVSVVIPTWNRAQTIQRAIDSALRQSLPVLEILVCDDGSTDETESVVRKIASQDARVRWIAGERGGRAAIPRNRGLRETRGEWVAFLDSDDEWLPKKLETQFEAANTLNARAACSNATRVTADGRVLGPLLDWIRPRLRFGDLLTVNRVVCSSCVVHRSLIAKTGGFPEEPEFKVGEDYVLWLRVATLTDFAYCPDTLVRYCDEPGSSIRSQQSVTADAQQRLVLAATNDWLRTGQIRTSRRIRALTSLVLMQGRRAVATFAGRMHQRVL